MITDAQQPPTWRAVFAGARGRLTIGLLLLEALVAVEIMVVATILPAVQANLHGLKLYGWIYALGGTQGHRTGRRQNQENGRDSCPSPTAR